MSGGHFNYCQYQVCNCLEEFALDPEVATRFPALAQSLNGLRDALSKILHDLDWDLSDDNRIDDDLAFENKATAMLFDALVNPDNRPDNRSDAL